MKQREEINSAVSSHFGVHVCSSSITWPVLPDRVNFMIKKKRKYNKMGVGGCFVITNYFSSQLKTSIFFFSQFGTN